LIQNDDSAEINIDFFKNEGLIADKLVNATYKTYNFNIIPPVIGIIISNHAGINLLVLEYDFENDENFKTIDSYISDDEKGIFKLDMVSSYFCSLKAIAGEINIQNLEHFEIRGSNIKVQVYFISEKFLVVTFLNSNTNLIPEERKKIKNYFKYLIAAHEFEFNNYNAECSRQLFRKLKKEGRAWLRKLNVHHEELYKSEYLRKHEIIENFSKMIDPRMKNIISENLETLPENIAENLSRELSTTIQDGLFDYLPKIQRSI